MFQTLDEYFENKSPKGQILKIIMKSVGTFKSFVWMPLKPDTFRMSLPKVIMIANTFTMSILCVPFKPNTFRVSFPEMIKITNVFTSQKHQISKKND